MLTYKGIKALKRILKETGIYNLWLKERELTNKNENINKRKGIFNFKYVEDNSCFSLIIDESFWWDETRTPYLWDKLYEATSCKSQSILKLAEDTESLKEIKGMVKAYI